MGKMKKSKTYHTVMVRNKPMKKYLHSEFNFSKDGIESEGSEYYKGEKVMVRLKKITKKNEVIYIDKILRSTGELITVDEYRYKYDGKGNLIYNAVIENGEVKNENFYKYDNTNKKVLEFGKDIKGNEFKSEIIYDDQGREAELIITRSNEIDVRVIYEYDNNDKVVTKNFYDSKMVLQGKLVIYYDVQKNPIYRVNYDNAGNIVSSMLNVYDGEGLLEYAEFDKDQIIVERKSYKYYENNKLIEKQTDEYFSGGKPEKKDIYEWEYEFYDE